jgi:DNA polymerase III sliding clamp (beta) subunit (PCNA family)
MARIEHANPYIGVVATKIFKSWPKGPISILFTKMHAYFKIGHDEMRVAPLYHGEYPNLAKIIPDRHADNYALVEVEVLIDLIKRGIELAELKLLILEFEENELIIKVWKQESTTDKFVGKIPILHGDKKIGKVLIKGDYLLQALKEAMTPNVRLCYGEVTMPLRIESGPYLACIWQMVC